MKISNNHYVQPVSDIVEYAIGANKSVPSILDNWSINKYHIYKKFGENTIVNSKELSLEVEDNNEISRSYNNFKRNVYDIIRDNNFLCNCFYDFFAYGVSIDGFKNNEVLHDWDSSDTEKMMKMQKDKPTFSVKKGTKFSRACRVFFNSKDFKEEEKLKTLQNLYSTYRQKLSNKKKGRLFLSIDPYDFLSISDNNHNWSSCHNLLDGEYRIGNLNYMADSTTIVGYYCSNDLFDEELEAFGNIKAWNSKKWRVLIHLQVIDGKIIAVYNRQYPFTSDKLLEELDKLLLSFLPEVEITNSILKEYCYKDEVLPNNYAILDRASDTCHYNDFRAENGCFIRMSKDYIQDPSSIIPIEVGHHVYCLECGERITDRGEDGLCEECSDEFFCENCEEYHSYRNAKYLENEDRYICEDCYEREHEHCDKCGEIYHYDSIDFVEMLGQNICNTCFNKMREQNATIIYSINDMARQILNGKDNQQLEKIYKEVSEEKQNLKIEFRKKTDIVITSTIIIPPEPGTDSTASIANRQKETIDIHDNVIYRVNRLLCRPLEILSDQEQEIPQLKHIILTGSTDVETLSIYVNDAYESLDKMTLPRTMLDYSRVRII